MDLLLLHLQLGRLRLQLLLLKFELGRLFLQLRVLFLEQLRRLMLDFDVVLEEGFEWALTQKLLHITFKNLNERKRTPERMIRQLYAVKASAQS